MKPLHITGILAKLNIKEALLSPGYAIAATISTLVGYLVIVGFVGAIDSHGFNPMVSPLFGNLVSALSGLFGTVMVARLFSQGPLLVALYASSIPMIAYCVSSSLVKYNLEKDVGAIELIMFGPTDHMAYSVALLIKDVVCIALYLVFLTVFFLITATLNNLLLGPAFGWSLLMLLFLSLAIGSYARLCSALADSGAGSLFLFYGLMIFFAFIYLGSFTVVSDYLRTFSEILSLIVQWVSPFYFSSIVLNGMEIGSAALVATGFLLILALSSVLLLVATHMEKRKGVSA
jgi:hypothetical protein